MINSVAFAVTFICAIRSATVAIEEPPHIVKGPAKHYVYHVATSADQTEHFTLECEASGEPAVEYRWIKNDSPFDVSANPRITRFPRVGTIKFDPTSPDDEGYYQCIAENILGTSLSNIALLKKFDMSGFSNQSTVEKYVKKGEPITLTCDRPIGYPQPSIFWNLQQSNGALEQIADPRISADEDGNLHFSSVTEKDVKTNGATYACMAASVYKNEYKIGTRYVLLFDDPDAEETQVKPKLQFASPESLTVLKGDYFVVSCIVGGNPTPEIEWQKDDGPIFSKTSPVDGYKFIFKNNGRTLAFMRAEFGDSGIYRCMAKNGF
ncbi:neuronal cell adhesion molecule-like protein, partial [Leptotrombidium deliense]